MIKNIINPNPFESLKFVNRHHIKKPEKTSLIIIGDCMINYHGRAKSLLDWGQRIIIIKQDANILIHRPIMREPVNWLPIFLFQGPSLCIYAFYCGEFVLTAKI